MGYEDLVQYLTRNAEAKREEILGRNRMEAERLATHAQEEEARMEQASNASLAQEIERERRIRMRRIRMEARIALQHARYKLMEEILSRLEHRLSHLSQEEHYPHLVEQWYRELLPEFPEGNVILRADNKALAVLASLISDPRVRLESLPDEEVGGLEVSDADRRFRIRNTLKARLMKARPLVMEEINQWLADTDE